MNCVWKNLIIYEGFGLIFQIVFAFTFLTLFLFAYVVLVEQQQFKDQINFVVDTLLPEKTIKSFIKDVSGKGKIDPEILVAFVSGIIDGISFKLSEDERGSVVDVVNNNNKIRTGSLTLLSAVLAGLILVTCILLIFGVCIPVKQHIVSSLWVLLAIALCELAFLQLIAKRYRSADPNKVKNAIAVALISWICNNKDIAKDACT